MRFTLYYDAGHGWLAVTEAEAAQIGLTEGDFSHYSYKFGDTLYLEEDLDAGVFIRTWEAHRGPIVLHAVDHGDYSPIRNYARVQPRLVDDEIDF